MSGRKVNTHICNFSTFWNHFMQILESAWTLHFKLLASFKLQMSKIFPLGGLLQLEVTKALKTNYHSTSTTTNCSITWHLIAEPEYHCNQFCMLIHCSAGIGNVVHLIWLSGGFSWYFISAKSKLAQLSELQHCSNWLRTRPKRRSGKSRHSNFTIAIYVRCLPSEITLR